MESISTIVTAALGYILKGASQSKVAETAKEELLGGFWKWVRPWFIRDVLEVEEKPDTAETETKTGKKLLELIKDEKFFDELARRVTELQKAGIKEKNIVRGSIEDMEEITIGDKVYLPNETYQRKNIVEGSVKGGKIFVLGDGH
ncbi:MAG: hypothetical protein WCP85_08140 [Mariniphaga sp.]